MAQANQSDRCFSFQWDFLIVRVAKFVETLGTMFRSSQLRGELGNHIAYFEAKLRNFTSSSKYMWAICNLLVK